MENPFDFLKEKNIVSSPGEMEKARKYGKKFVSNDPASEHVVIGYEYHGKIFVESMKDNKANALDAGKARRK